MHCFIRLSWVDINYTDSFSLDFIPRQIKPSLTVEPIYEKKKEEINIKKYKKNGTWKAVLSFIFCPMLAQYVYQQLFNHENHTLILAGINTRVQHFKYYMTVRKKWKKKTKWKLAENFFWKSKKKKKNISKLNIGICYYSYAHTNISIAVINSILFFHVPF